MSFRLDDLHSVGEPYTENYLRQLVVAIEATPVFLESPKVSAAREREAPTPEVYEKSLAGQWRELGCAAEGAPYVLDGLIAQLDNPLIPPFRDQSDATKALAKDFLDDAHCPGAHGLSEADKAKLKMMAALPVAPQAPKP